MSEVSSQKNDEIDLIELFRVLWQKKVWIVLSAFVCTLIAGVYAFTAKEQWTSKAVVIAPRLSEFSDYYTLNQEYVRISNQEFNDKEKSPSEKLSDEFFTGFNLALESLNVRNDFFSNSSYYKKLAQGKSKDEQRKIISDFVTKNINIIKPDLKKDPLATGVTVTLSAETPEDAQVGLSQFIELANNSTLSVKVNDFKIHLVETISNLQFEKMKFETDLQIQKNIQLSNLENALGIAKQAGLQNYADSFSAVSNRAPVQTVVMSETKSPLSELKLSDGTYLFMLGEKYLKAQIDVLKQSNVVYPSRYYEVSTLLSQLEPLLAKVNNVKAQAFSYQASPDYPAVKDKPKKALILIIGFIVGLVLSTFVILLGSFVQTNKKQ